MAMNHFEDNLANGTFYTYLYLLELISNRSTGATLSLAQSLFFFCYCTAFSVYIYASALICQSHCHIRAFHFSAMPTYTITTTPPPAPSLVLFRSHPFISSHLLISLSYLFYWKFPLSAAVQQENPGEAAVFGSHW